MTGRVLMAALAGPLIAMVGTTFSWADELNDDPRFADIVPLHWQSEVNISTEDDIDWLRFLVPADGLLTLSQIGAGTNASHLSFTLHNSETEAEIALGTELWEGEDRNFVARVEAGIYLIAASGAADTYTLLLDFETDSDLEEPNDRPVTAGTGFGETRIRSFPGGDADWFAVPADTLSVLTVDIEREDANAPYYGAEILLDGAQDPVPLELYWSKSPSGGDVQRSNLNLLPGTHYVRLFSDPARSYAWVKFNVGAQDDPFEPNDTAEMARVIEPGEALSFVMFRGDVDWVAMELTEAGRLELTFDPSADGNYPYLELFAAKDVTAPLPFAVAQADRAEAELTPGLYYLRLRPYHDGDRRPYRLATHFVLPAAPSTPDPSDDANSFFMIGLDSSAEILDELDHIAEAGGGEVVVVPADESELAASFGRIIAASRGEIFGPDDFMMVTLTQIFERSYRPPEAKFDTGTFAAALTAVWVDANQGRPSRQPMSSALFVGGLTATFERNMTAARRQPSLGSRALIDQLKTVLLGPK